VKAEARITLTYRVRREAKSICDGISPDNLKRPKSLLIETWVSDGSVITHIEYYGERITTLLSTIDDLLSCVATAERAISAIKRSI
ncbi:MAG: KEOPS complex subunit Pcc1, partial [Candidatus Bathyarchaeota archaeon]|nr:KEOPS complex subunit Pcc1 [Candidatus Bathyarchaeota archaeon]